MERQHSENTSFWLQGLIKLLNTVPEKWRQETFDTYISGKDITKYGDGLRDIADRYSLGFNATEVRAVLWKDSDIELSDLRGSVLFDMFYKGELEKLVSSDEFKEFTNAMKSQGVSVYGDYPQRGIIRVYNDGKELPIQVLGRAHKWAHEKGFSHGYK